MKTATESALGLAALGVRLTSLMLATAAASKGAAGPASAPGADLRLREVVYDPQAVVNVPVKRGLVTLVVLDADESITELASGLGGDCAKPDASWCIAAQPGGRTVFVKPKSSAVATNNMAVVTSQRIHNLRFQVLADSDPRPSLYRLIVHAPPAVPPVRRANAEMQRVFQAVQSPQLPALPTAEQLVSERLQAKPSVLNTQYSLSEGKDSQDIVPTLVFDDGRFTYLRLPGNREVPAAFQVLGDGSEALVNARVEDDLLVIDRVARRLMLRAGGAVVGLWNDAFDVEGVPADLGTTVPGVRRALRTSGAPPVLPSAPSSSALAASPHLQTGPVAQPGSERESALPPAPQPEFHRGLNGDAP